MCKLVYNGLRELASPRAKEKGLWQPFTEKHALKPIQKLISFFEFLFFYCVFFLSQASPGGHQAAIFLHANPKKSIFQKYAQKLKNVNLELS